MTGLSDDMALLDEAIERGREARSFLPLIKDQIRQADQAATAMQHRIILVKDNLPVVTLDRAVDTIIGATAELETIVRMLSGIGDQLQYAENDVERYKGIIKQ